MRGLSGVADLGQTILYLLPAGSFSELWPVIVSIIFGLPQPLSSIQMVRPGLVRGCSGLSGLVWATYRYKGPF